MFILSFRVNPRSIYYMPQVRSFGMYNYSPYQNYFYNYSYSQPRSYGWNNMGNNYFYSWNYAYSPARNSYPYYYSSWWRSPNYSYYNYGYNYPRGNYWGWNNYYGNYGQNYGYGGYGLNQLASIMDGANIGIPYYGGGYSQIDSMVNIMLNPGMLASPYYNTGGYSQIDSMVNIMLNPNMLVSPYMRFNGGPGMVASNIFNRRGRFFGSGGISPAFLGSG